MSQQLSVYFNLNFLKSEERQVFRKINNLLKLQQKLEKSVII